MKIVYLSKILHGLIQKDCDKLIVTNQNISTDSTAGLARLGQNRYEQQRLCYRQNRSSGVRRRYRAGSWTAINRARLQHGQGYAARLRADRE